MPRPLRSHASASDGLVSFQRETAGYRTQDSILRHRVRRKRRKGSRPENRDVSQRPRRRTLPSRQRPRRVRPVVELARVTLDTRRRSSTFRLDEMDGTCSPGRRRSSDDDRLRPRGPYTQPPIPSLSLSIEGVMEGPEIRGREHDNADPRKASVCATQPQGCPQIAEKMFRTNDELGLSHRTTAYSRRAPSPSRSIQSKRRRGAASSEVTPWPPASVGAAWPPSTRLLTKTFTSSARPFRRKDQMTVLPPSTRIVFTSRAARRSRRASKSTSSLPRRMTSARGNERSLSSDVTINVGALPSKMWAESGILPSESKTTRRGFRPFAYSDFTVSFGSSFRTVPTPTRIASTAARRRCTRRRSSSLLSRTPLPSGSAIFPSTLI